MMVIDLESWDKQLRKGVLDLAMLSCLWNGRLYGLELINRLKEVSNLIVVEGTVYPILKRLDNEGWVQSKWEYESAGHPRKYYTLTRAGRDRCGQMSGHWLMFSSQVGQLLKLVEKDSHHG